MRPDIEEFRSMLRYERTVRNISQTELAEAIGITQAHLSYIEHGKRDLTIARYNKILEYFEECGDPYDKRRK